MLIYDKNEISMKMQELAHECEEEMAKEYENIEAIANINTVKVMKAFIDNKISEVHFNASTGYGYDDVGREAIEKIYAQVFGTEDALVRIQFVNGTHALSTALMANLKNGDTLLSITGLPYDTLHQTIGIEKNSQSLISNGVNYEQIELVNNEFDVDNILWRINDVKLPKVTMIFIGRSRGYSTRNSISVEKIGEITKKIKDVDNNIVVMVDNSYGEFVESVEPTNYGVDIMAGSLIKNIGGGICETGAYIVGKKQYVENSAQRLTAPGIGKECGATLGKNREILQGLFVAPVVVKNAIKTATFAANVFEKLGYVVNPTAREKRTDIVQMIYFNDEQKLIKFVRGIQQASPIDSFVVPEAWDMPGYASKVIMAAGTFISGASIELSADAPIRPPYVAYLQGGLTYESAKYMILKAIQNI